MLIRTRDDFLHSEIVSEKADQIDGAPDDYWQVYADDQGPFEFPLISDWVTKSLTAPTPLKNRLIRMTLKMWSWIVSIGLLAYLQNVPILMVAAVIGFLVVLRSMLIEVWVYESQSITTS